MSRAPTAGKSSGKSRTPTDHELPSDFHAAPSTPPEILRDGHASVPVHLTIAGLDKGPSPRVGGRMNAMRKHIVGTMTHFSAE